MNQGMRHQKLLDELAEKYPLTVSTPYHVQIETVRGKHNIFFPDRGKIKLQACGQSSSHPVTEEELKAELSRYEYREGKRHPVQPPRERREVEPRQEGALAVGMDECGMGALAGPVVVAAVVIAEGIVAGVRDSKKVAESRRYGLADAIRDKAVFVHVASRSSTEIDERGLEACWAECVAECRDAVQTRSPGLTVFCDWADKPLAERVANVTFVRNGDSEVYAIAAASLVAKAHHDRYMVEVGREFPQYGLGKHKGYGTPDHWAAIRKHGLTPIHRRAAAKAGR